MHANMELLDCYTARLHRSADFCAPCTSDGEQLKSSEKIPHEYLMTLACPCGTFLQKEPISLVQAVFMRIWKSMDSAMPTSSSNSSAEH